LDSDTAQCPGNDSAWLRLVSAILESSSKDLQIGPNCNSLSKEQQGVVPSVAQNCRAKKTKPNNIKCYSRENYQMKTTVCKGNNKQRE